MTSGTVKVSRAVALTIADQVIHTVYESRTFEITMIHLVNTTAVPVTVQVCAVPQGGTKQQANALLWDYEIPAHDFIEFGEGHLLLPGGSIRANANADNAVNLILAGTEE